MGRRAMALLLSLAMALSLMASPALAADTSAGASVQSSAEEESHSQEEPKEDKPKEDSSQEEKPEEKPSETPDTPKEDTETEEQPEEGDHSDPEPAPDDSGDSSSSSSGENGSGSGDASQVDPGPGGDSTDPGSSAGSASLPEEEPEKSQEDVSSVVEPEEKKDGSVKELSASKSVSEAVEDTKNVKLVSDQTYSSTQKITAANFSDYDNSTEKATGATIAYKRLVTLQVTGLVADQASAGQDNLTKVERAMSLVESYSKDEDYASTLFKVIIPKGTYYLDGTPVKKSNRCVHLYRNTWLSMNGVTFVKKDTLNRASIRAGLASEKVDGYEGESNIILEGGTWDMNVDNHGSSSNHFSNVRFGHDKNILIANVTFQGAVSGHHLELCGVKNVSVVGCTFLDYKDSGYTKGINRNEAIQIDVTNSSNLTPTYANYDDTVSGNVVIYDNTFSNLSRGVGSHSADYGKYYDKVVIQNNTFRNVTYQAIFCENYRNCAITGNKISNCGGGIEFNALCFAPDGNYYKPNSGMPAYSDIKTYNAKTVISNNTISVKAKSTLTNASGIYVHGGVYNGSTFKDSFGGKTFRLTGVTISQNTITRARDAGIYLAYTGSYTVAKNKISGVVSGSTAKGNGIYLTNSTGGKLTTNTVSGNAAHGIYIINCSGSSSKRVALLSNQVATSKSIGIYVKNSKYVGIAKSKVSAKSYAVYFNGASNCYVGNKKAYKNTLKSSAKYGVYLTGKSKTGMTVTYNSITATSKAVYAASGSKVKTGNNSFTKKK